MPRASLKERTLVPETFCSSIIVKSSLLESFFSLDNTTVFELSICCCMFVVKTNGRESPGLFSNKIQSLPGLRERQIVCKTCRVK